MRYAPGRMAARNSALTSCFVSAVGGHVDRHRIRTPRHLERRLGSRRCPAASPPPASGSGDHATTRIPNACARVAISRPICPSPTMPSVRPCRPRALEYSPLFHLPAPQLGHLVRDPPVAGEQQAHHQLRHRDRVLARAVGDEDAEARRRRHVDRVDPGAGPDHQAQARPRLERRRRSPACPARSGSADRPARSAPGSVSAPRSGCDSTSQPSSFRPSMPTFSNLSAMRTRMIPIVSRQLQSSECRRPEPADSRRCDSDSAQFVHEQPASQLRLEPRALRRHDLPRIRHRQQLLHRRRVQRDRRAPSRPLVTRRSSSAVPRMPPTKSIRLSVRGSAMPRIGPSTRSCSSDTSSEPIGSRRSIVASSSVEQPPARPRGRTRTTPGAAAAGPSPRSSRPSCREPLAERRRREPVERLHHPVVGQDRAARPTGTAPPGTSCTPRRRCAAGFAARRSWPARHALAER